MPHCSARKGGVLALLFFSAVTAAAPDRRITSGEARELAREALKARHLDGPTVELTPMAYVKDFYTFEATWPNPEGSPNLGAFAVNPWTGDVWQVVVCERITSPAIEKMRRSIRARFHRSAKEYRKLGARTPAC